MLIRIPQWITCTCKDTKWIWKNHKRYIKTFQKRWKRWNKSMLSINITHEEINSQKIVSLFETFKCLLQRYMLKLRNFARKPLWKIHWRNKNTGNLWKEWSVKAQDKCRDIWKTHGGGIAKLSKDARNKLTSILARSQEEHLLLN